MTEHLTEQPAPADVVPRRQPTDDEQRQLWLRLNNIFTRRRAVLVDVSEPGDVQLDDLGTPVAVGQPRVRRGVPMVKPLVSAAELRRLGLNPEEMTGLRVIE